MMRQLLLFLLLLPIVSWASSDPLLPDDTYLKTVTQPEQAFGQPVGKRHLRYDQVLHYFRTLAEQSPRVAIESAGLSHQGRQQIAAVITSERNQQNLDNILAKRAKVTNGDAVGGPTVVWLAYSIHGDEASGLHAGTLFAYYLAASTSPEVERWLDEMVILITPSQNPDGNDRFANWVNSYTGHNLNGSDWHREHFQGWPSGRVNHFMADLNRDWLYLRHPESRGRVAVYQRWQPHVVGDFHEMGHNASYFFQPGVPSRTHPLTPTQNQSLTAALGRYHAEALDAIGQPYFSKESFDDFYYGKGSTYPDINGGVGILFEQASVRGHIRDTDFGKRTFREAIRNQLATSFSTVRGSYEQQQALVQYQRDFYVDSLERGEDRKGSGLVVGARGDQGRLAALAEVLSAHQVQFGWTEEALEALNIQFASDSLFIPFAQPKYALVEALFDHRTEFEDNTFYDVSAFAVDLAFNLEVADLRREPDWRPSSDSSVSFDYQPALAWVIPWEHRATPKALNTLLNAGVRVRFIETEARLQGRTGSVDVEPGALMIQGRQPNLEILLPQIAEMGVVPEAIVRGQALNGPDLGSRKFHSLNAVKPMILVGRNASQYEVGQLWNYLDQQVGIAATLVDGEYAARVPMEDFTHLFMVDGRYRQLDAKLQARIERFVREGGVLVAWQGGAEALARKGMAPFDIKGRQDLQQQFDEPSPQFAERSADRAKRTIGGAIVNWQLDVSHPLAYGVGHQLPMMKDREMVLAPSEIGRVVATYDEQPLLSGFMAEAYQQTVGNEASAVVTPVGQGVVVALSDNPLFRNFWLGSERIVANALFMVPALH